MQKENTDAEKELIEKMPLVKIAEEISLRLQQLESDALRNPIIGGKHALLYRPFASYGRGQFVVRYRSYAGQEDSNVTEEQARHFLRWLRDGNIGTHDDARRFFEGEANSDA